MRRPTAVPGVLAALLAAPAHAVDHPAAPRWVAPCRTVSRSVRVVVLVHDGVALAA
jgi:hypothetical protein